MTPAESIAAILLRHRVTLIEAPRGVQRTDEAVPTDTAETIAAEIRRTGAHSWWIEDQGDRSYSWVYVATKG